MKTYLSFLVILVLALFSCNKHDRSLESGEVVQIPVEFSLSGPDETILSDGNIVNIDGTGGEVEFDITSNALWKIHDNKIDSNWIIVGPVEDTRDGTLKAILEPNRSGVDREQEITFDVADKLEFMTIVIKQEVLADAISATTENGLMQGSYQHKMKFDVVSSSDWDVDLSDIPWLKENNRSVETISFTVQKNEDIERVGNIKFFLKSNPSVSDELTIVQLQGVVVADYLDVEFNVDGTAKDVSQAHHEVLNFNDKNIYTISYDNSYERNIANFLPEPENITLSEDDGGFFRIDNTKDFADFTSKATSWEVLIKVNSEWGNKSYEGKFFGMHEAGGIGFLISSSSRGNKLTWLPNISTRDGGGSRWIWTSGVTPVEGKWYHLIGTWDKSTGRSKLFLNGDLVSDVEAEGFWHPAAGGVNWICIGGDPNRNNEATNAVQASISIARIYKHALNQEEVDFLWNEVKKD